MHSIFRPSAHTTKMEREELFRKRVQDLCRMAYQRDIVTFTDFLDLNELHIIHNLDLKQWGVSLACFGGYEMSERQIAAFIPDALSYDWEFPVCCLKIQLQDRRFSQEPGHRDYLGALLNLGIERSMLGDILIDQDAAYVFCAERMAGFIREELTRVRNTPVVTSVLCGELPSITHKYKEITGTVASVRLDSIISTAFQTSRNGITSLIESGKVFVNGKLVTSNGSMLKENDIVSVRGMGKFQFEGVLSRTKKGRILVKINRYS